jgi:hypothetical protein
VAFFYSLDRIHMADEAEIYPRHDSECWYEDTSLTDETRATNIGSHTVVCTFRGLGSFTRGRDCDYNTVSLEGKKKFAFGISCLFNNIGNLCYGSFINDLQGKRICGRRRKTKCRFQ